MKDGINIGLIRDVFFQKDGPERLRERLDHAKELGAEVAVLPEIPLNPWSPATKQIREEDAELPGGPRHEIMASAAREIGIGLIGGAIIKHPETGVRSNTALVFDASGELVGSYAKLHVPEEEGFWETSHYDPAENIPKPFDSFGMKIGVQICSDNQRPEGAQMLRAQGAEIIVVPRSTTGHFLEQWRFTFLANAWTSGCFVLSVNRPEAEQGVPISGPNIAVSPLGKLITENGQDVCVVTCKRSVLEEARREYPGYLPLRADLYARGWKGIAGS